MLNLSTEEMAKMMTAELLDGCLDDPTVKAGFVGEIGCSYPICGEYTSNEAILAVDGATVPG